MVEYLAVDPGDDVAANPAMPCMGFLPKLPDHQIVPVERPVNQMNDLTGWILKIIVKDDDVIACTVLQTA